MRRRTLILLALSGCLAVGACSIAVNIEKWSKAEGQACPHLGQIDRYDALAPTKVELGRMLHYACCDCHAAWADYEKTNEIGNTVTKREKIDIFQKTQIVEIGREDIITNSDLVYLVEDAPYVRGLDQTDWSIANGGVGGGTYKFYQIDGRKAVRISTETLIGSQYSTLDSSNKGYSSFAIQKELSSGTITVSFDYKMYDLNTTSYSNEPRTHAVFEGRDYNEIVELDFATDNKWHSYSFSSISGFELDTILFNMHHFNGEMYIANLSVTSNGLHAPVIETHGAGVRFSTVSGADYYVVHDNNNNPNQITINADQAEDGLITYRPEAAGMHDIYVTAHSNDENIGYSTSSVIEDVEVSPVFYYDNFANEYYVDKTWVDTKNSWIQGGDYKYDTTDIDRASGWGSVTSGSTEYYHAYYTDDGAFTQDANQRLRFNSTEANSNLARIVSEAKELGTNVLQVSHNDSYLNGDQKLEDNAELKIIMDYAYANNLKVIVMSNAIYAASASGTDEATIRSQVYNYLSAYGTSLIQHPAFYGFTLRDEPTNNEQDVYRVSWTARAVKDYFTENYVSKNLAVECPFFVCALLQQGNGDTFCCDPNYMYYVENWLRITGLNYYSTDIYTYTTQVYNTSSFNGSSTDEVIDLNYEIYMKLKSRYKGLRMHLTTTANNDKYNRSAVNQYDIYGSTLYAAALNNYGISRYSYYPAIWTYHWQNGVVNRNGSHTSKYNWIKGAQSQFEMIQDKLYGYEATSLSTQTNGGYSSTSANTRRMDVELTKGEETAKMVVNYNSQSNKTSSFSVAIPANKSYYLFGNGVNTAGQYSANGVNVTLTNGQAVLITNEDLSGLNVDSINELIANANGLKLKSNIAYAQFALLANEIDSIYSSLSPISKNKVVGYETYLNNKQLVDKNANILYDQTFNYYENNDGTNPIFTKVSDSSYGEMNSMDFAYTRNYMQLWLETNLIDEDWSSYTRLGFFLKADAPITDRGFFNVNNVWGSITANITTIDASSNLYFYEFDLSSISAAFTDQTQFEIYFGSNLNHVEISNFVNISRFEISSPITAANKNGSGAWGSLDKNENQEFVWEKSYSTMAFANRTYVDPAKFTDVVITVTNTCDVNLYVAYWGGIDWARVPTDLNVGTTISFKFSVDVWNNGETIYLDCYEIGNDSSSKGSILLSLEPVFEKDYSKYQAAVNSMNSLSTNNRSDLAKFILKYPSVDALLNELTTDEKNALNGYSTYTANKATATSKAGILYSGGYKCVNDDKTLTAFTDNDFGTMHRQTDPSGTQVNNREIKFLDDLTGVNWGKYAYMGIYVRYDHTVSDAGVFLPDNNWSYSSWGNQSRGATLIDANTNLYYYEWPVDYLSAFTNGNSAISFYFAGGGVLVNHTYMEVSNIVFFN